MNVIENVRKRVETLQVGDGTGGYLYYEGVDAAVIVVLAILDEEGASAERPFREWEFPMVFHEHPGLYRLPVVTGDEQEGDGSRLLVFEDDSDAEEEASVRGDGYVVERVRIVLDKGPAAEEG